ncbi:nitrogenase iron protein NifH [Rhodoplanes sp. TEM]|uniref:Nitrogenase iron protein NifH n=1 Tax=Rhodoplanes tepidamans TaxID=200616 RepID=A0ABT5JJI4_RHOTP|nr:MULTISPECIES: nitrogenase iron protein NifH [Rhodoplanes]MDC7789653.1 nitrogenase iron protein NifH [Rhodoplanes tepidamans]MDC7987072.1 nitrogenase iron protein NifH [Rhodoplanes sp. TEM]MDQ0353589.1 nitrogenase iron protein NifH [Rhodoplanes tepidamans]
MKKIAIYGKGGIGKSTTVSNLSAALARRGLRVVQIGCDPKADSTKGLTGGRQITSVLEVLRAKKTGSTLDDLVVEGDLGVLCVEAGGPTPGIGCAGRGIIAAFDRLEELDAWGRLAPDVVLFDVLGDVVCGGFAMPMRKGYADEVAIVSSGEMMALYAAHNIASALANFATRGYARLAGIIQNSRNVPDEDDLVRRAAAELNTAVIGIIPRCELVQKAEDQGRTVVACFPDSAQAGVYLALSRLLVPDAATEVAHAGAAPATPPLAAAS